MARSTGDEVARSTGGGIITHTTQGKAYFQAFSMDVMVEGQPAVRHLDLLTHNRTAKIPGNTPPAPWMSKMLAGPGVAPGEVDKQVGRKKDKGSWVKFTAQDKEGFPLAWARYSAKLPDGRVVEGRTPFSGIVRLRGFPKGQVELAFLDFDATSFEGAKPGEERGGRRTQGNRIFRLHGVAARTRKRKPWSQPACRRRDRTPPLAPLTAFRRLSER